MNNTHAQQEPRIQLISANHGDVMMEIQDSAERIANGLRRGFQDDQVGVVPLNAAAVDVLIKVTAEMDEAIEEARHERQRTFTEVFDSFEGRIPGNVEAWMDEIRDHNEPAA